MEHPDITHARLTGYPRGIVEPRELGLDSLGNQIYEGDRLLVFGDYQFTIDELSYDAIEILEMIGADFEEA